MNKDLLDFFAQQKKVTNFVEIICSAKKSYKICRNYLLSKKKLQNLLDFFAQQIISTNNLKKIYIKLLYMSKESLQIFNKKVIDFYKKNTQLDFEIMNCIFVDFLEKLMNDINGTINNTITNDILSNVKDISKELSSIKTVQTELVNIKEIINNSENQ